MKLRISSCTAAVVAAALCVFLAPNLRASDYLSTAGVLAADYQKWVEEVSANGYRPIYVSGLNAGGKPQFAGVAVKNANGPAWEARHNLTSDDYQTAFEKLTADGYRPLSVSGYLRLHLDGHRGATRLVQQRLQEHARASFPLVTVGHQQAGEGQQTWPRLAHRHAGQQFGACRLTAAGTQESVRLPTKKAGNSLPQATEIQLLIQSERP